MEVKVGDLLDKLVEVVQSREDVVPVTWVWGILVGWVPGRSLPLTIAVVGEDGWKVVWVGGLEVVDYGDPRGLGGCEAVEEDEESFVGGLRGLRVKGIA